MKLEKIKLNRLAENSLANREMKELKGGNCCLCACRYANEGRTSTNDNMNANYDHNYTSVGHHTPVDNL